MDNRVADKTADSDLSRFLGQAPAAPWRRLLPLAALAVLAAGGAAGWMALRAGGERPRYAATPVERGDLRVTVSATGNLKPTNQVEVGSELSGIVTRVYADNNDRVVRGQLLAELDTARLGDAVRQGEAGLAAAEAGVAQAEASVAEAGANLSRGEALFRATEGAAPARADLDALGAARRRADAGLLSARAAVRQAQASLSSARTSLAKAYIRSPVNGVVLSRAVEPGQTVAASFNAPVLFTLAEDLARMKLEVKVDEADVGQVRAGQAATFQVDAYPGRSFRARVERLDLGATAAAATGGSGQVIAYTAVLSAANPDLALRPGMTGTASIVAAEKRGVLLGPNAALRYTPARAALRGGGVAGLLAPRGRGPQASGGQVAISRGSRQTVYVLGDDGALQPLAVQVGDSNGSQAELSGEGLRPGVRLVTGELAAGRRGAGGS